jgi:CheY-like chemotaxis protein/predicted regulator of Ras-like GTPase activity (Roadblock/LC7/MglB family)
MKQVLIVDDEPELLLSIASGFQDNQRFRLFTAGNGREALDIILDNKVLDLVVTDLRMPVMDGIEFLSILEESFPEVPNIVMTAFGNPQVEKHLRKAGTLDVLEKPFDIDTLERAIHKALDVHEEQSCSLSGLALSSFLQLVALEQKTIHLKVFHPSGKNGSLFFREGELIDAEHDTLIGDEAVLEILSWHNTRVSMKEYIDTSPSPRVKSELLSLLFTAAQREDNPEIEEKPLEIARQELAKISSKKNKHIRFTLTQKGGKMINVKELLKKVADEIDGVLVIQVTGMDGIPLALHNPSGADVEAFSAKFAMVMKLVEKSVDSLKSMGELEENVVQTKNAWILTRCINSQYYIGIAVTRDGTLGNIRFVAQRAAEQLRSVLTPAQGK